MPEKKWDEERLERLRILLRIEGKSYAEAAKVLTREWGETVTKNAVTKQAEQHPDRFGGKPSAPRAIGVGPSI